MPNRRGSVRESHSRRARSYDPNVQPFVLMYRARLYEEFSFMAGSWINQAAGRATNEGVIETCLVASDALQVAIHQTFSQMRFRDKLLTMETYCVDIIWPSLAAFADNFRIREKRSRHRNQVRTAIG